MAAPGWVSYTSQRGHTFAVQRKILPWLKTGLPGGGDALRARQDRKATAEW